MRKLSHLWVLGVVFVLLSAAAGAGWLYGPDVSRMLAGRLPLACLATGILEYLLKQLLPIPAVPASFARTEDFAPPIAAGHSHPYPSKHAHRSTILLGAVYLLGTSSLWRAGVALALALLGLLASRVLSRDALDLGRRGRSVAGCQ